MCVPSSATVGIGVAGVGVNVAVGVSGGFSGVTVAVGGKNVAEGEIDGFGVVVAVAVTIVGVTTTGGGGAHARPSAASSRANRISPRIIRIIGAYLLIAFGLNSRRCSLRLMAYRGCRQSHTERH